MHQCAYVVVLALLMLTTLSWAQDKQGGEKPAEKKEDPAKVQEKGKELEDVTVTATGVKTPQKDFPGTVHAVTPKDIEEWKPVHSLDLLKRLPGVMALEEDPAGLKPSIGIRGLNPDRSRGGVVLLVDGIPFNPGPYSDPGAYYNVPIQQIERIEVIKGGSSILYGPNAVGGVVNYITKGAPKEPELWIRETIGNDALWVSELSYGGTWGEVSGYVNYSHRQGNGFRERSDFTTEDFATKWTFKAGTDTKLAIHFDYYIEDEETARGMSAASFQDSVRNSDKRFDFFEGERMSLDLVSTTRLSPDAELRILLYLFAFERNWHLETPSAFYGTNTLSAFKRDFNVLGVEPQVTARHDLFGLKNDLIAGFRISAEREFETLTEADDLKSRHGTAFSTSVIEALGFALYFQNAFHLTSALTVTPGVRFEQVTMSRDNNLAFSNLNDLMTSATPKGGTSGSDSFFNALPGVGVTFDLAEETTLHGGAWRTASLPEFGSGAEGIDKVTGEPRRLDAEIGMTYELGVRSTPSDWLSMDATLFLLTYDNQIGQQGAVLGNFNDTRHQGLELSVSSELGGVAGILRGLSAYVNFTWMKSKFTGGPFEGNATPNAPDVTVSAGLSYRIDLGETDFLSAGWNTLYVGSRFSDPANTVAENAAGTVGKLAAYDVSDIRLSYHKKDWNLEVFGGVRNILDEKYRLWRFGGGIIPGFDRTYYLGLSISF